MNNRFPGTVYLLPTQKLNQYTVPGIPTFDLNSGEWLRLFRLIASLLSLQLIMEESTYLRPVLPKLWGPPLTRGLTSPNYAYVLVCYSSLLFALSLRSINTTPIEIPHKTQPNVPNSPCDTNANHKNAKNPNASSKLPFILLPHHTNHYQSVRTKWCHSTFISNIPEICALTPYVLSLVINFAA